MEIAKFRPKNTLVFLGVLLVFFMSFLWMSSSWITHDEGAHLFAIQQFKDLNLLFFNYYGRWRGTWFNTTGPGVLLIFALINKIVTLHPVMVRVLYCLGFIWLYRLITKALGFSLYNSIILFLIFLLWLLCIPVTTVFLSGASLNLLMNLYGEGWALAFVLLTHVYSVLDDPKKSWLIWVFAFLAISSKLLSLLLVIVPLCFFVLAQLKNRKKIAAFGLKGLALSFTAFFLWQLWEYVVMGQTQYFLEWSMYFSWIMNGGGLDPTSSSVFDRFNRLSNGGFNLFYFFSLLGLALVGCIWSLRFLKGRKNFTYIILTSFLLFCFWFFLFSGRSWVRHFWLAYAVLGFCFSILLLERINKFKSLFGYFSLIFLMVMFLFSGNVSNKYIIHKKPPNF